MAKQLQMDQQMGQSFMDKMQTANLNSGNNTIKNKQDHITRGTYNKTEQIDALLNNNQINEKQADKHIGCQILKMETFMLGYQWKYNDYC